MAQTSELTVLKGGLLVDGTGSAARVADVEIGDGRINRVGVLGDTGGARVVDLDGLVICPGFIDIHTHFDAQIFWDPSMSPSSWHGVTSVVMGNCGFGIAPTREVDRSNMMETLEYVEGMSLSTLRAGIDWQFETFPEYLDAISKLPKRVNVGAFIGHTPVRIFVMGFDAATSRAASDFEIEEMRRIVVEALDAGAMGFSTSRAPNHNGAKGLPVPSRIAERRELIALFEAVPKISGKVVGMTFGPDLGLDDVAAISEDLGVRITWGSLLTGMFGPTGTALGMLEHLSTLGGEVWPQVSCRSIVVQIDFEDPAFLGLAPSFKEVFTVPRNERSALYRDESWRSRARSELDRFRPGIYERSTVDETTIHKDVMGIPISELATRRGVHPLDLMLDLSLDEDLKTRFQFVVHNNDPVELPKLLRDPRTVLGVHDAGAHVDMLCDAGFPSHLLGYWVREKE